MTGFSTNPICLDNFMRFLQSGIVISKKKNRFVPPVKLLSIEKKYLTILFILWDIHYYKKIHMKRHVYAPF